ncbi:MAG: ThuA domain-containing protein, partial [Phycisphaerales bacterium]|nr:ThuA domain-containing protein [Phycisphaerales bacterium]
MSPIRVTVWHEYRHEKKSEAVRKLYPDGMHTVIAAAIKERLGDNVLIKTATLDEPDHGLTDDVLANTDVMTWWGHNAHAEVADAIVDKVCKRVLEGMGLLVLHSGHYTKPFKKLMGT